MRHETAWAPGDGKMPVLVPTLSALLGLTVVNCLMSIISSSHTKRGDERWYKRW